MTLGRKVKKMIDDLRPKKSEVWVYYDELNPMLMILTYNEALVTDVEEGNSYTRIVFETTSRERRISIEQDMKRFGVGVVASNIEI